MSGNRRRPRWWTAFKALTKAVPLPIGRLHSPRRTGLNMDPDNLAAVCDAAANHRSQGGVARRLPRHRNHQGASPAASPSSWVRARSSSKASPWAPGASSPAGPSFSARGVAASLCTVALENRPPRPAIRTSPDRYLRLPDGRRHLAGGPQGGPQHDRRAAGVPREPVQPLSPKDAEKLKALLEGLGVPAHGPGAGRGVEAPSPPPHIRPGVDPERYAGDGGMTRRWPGKGRPPPPLRV